MKPLHRPSAILASTVLLFASVSFAVSSAAAQTNRERVSGGYYDRSHDYDLVHQRIEVSGFDWDSTSFKGRVATTLVARRPGMDSVVLDAGHLLRIRQVTSGAGAALRFRTHGDSLVVFPARPAAFGDTVRFTVAYDGKVRSGRGLTFLESEGRPHRPRQIWSQGEATENHNWFPTYDFPNDKATWEVHATVPRGYTAVSNGRLLADVTNPDGTHTTRWSQTQPSATYLVSLVVAPLAKVHDTWRGKPVDYYVYAEDAPLARRLFGVTPDMMEVYSRLTGVAYPWDKYAQTTVADFFGGMENVSATTLVDWLPDERAYQDRPWFQHILIPHELAHQWFGDYVTTDDWANLWLNEGFAEFMPGQYWNEKLGRRVEDDYYADEYRQLMGTDARRRMPVAAEGSNNVYPKGALVLKMLKDYLGPQRFWASVNRYLTTHAYGTATTDDFRQAVRDATGEDMDWFFDQWLYQAGFPEFDVAQSYDAAAHRLTLRVRQTQVDSSKADEDGLRFTTPAVFRMPVTVMVGTDAGDVTRTFQLDAREQTLVMDGVAEPRMVVFDVDNHILKKLAFPQPTAWLAAQLRRDPALWNRQWAIDQLAAKKDDAAALAALADAAAHADYPLTRAQAARALGGFPEASALPPLQAALRDTSSRVRSAAVEALGTVGGARAAGLARGVFDGDASYDVRAAAVRGATRADTAGRAELIRRALAADSYRDAVRNAALTAASASGDESLIPAVEAQLGAGTNAANSLAAFARRGSTRALSVLVSHLNDPRAYVRTWAVRSLRQLDAATAAAPLRAALPSIRYPETRQAAEDALRAMESRGAR
ncbi:MAG TPA: M1 family aminopeptidase [Longimicrobiaceae bacterium]|nr:M1 family aminopeptidase [Longimicrobiaceae bacterium]